MFGDIFGDMFGLSAVTNVVKAMQDFPVEFREKSDNQPNCGIHFIVGEMFQTEIMLASLLSPSVGHVNVEAIKKRYIEIFQETMNEVFSPFEQEELKGKIIPRAKDQLLVTIFYKKISDHLNEKINKLNEKLKKEY